MEALIRRYYQPVVGQLIQTSKKLGFSPIEIAERIALAELDTRKHRVSRSGELVKLGRRIRRYLPSIFHKKMATKKFIDNMESIRRELGNAGG